MTELRLAGATDIKEDNFVLEDFVDRFNDRFGVPAQEPESAYRPTDPQMCVWTRSYASDTLAKWPGTTP